ncbi:MAG TPA: DUF6657 family protein [Spirochaetia bacterium]|nr:DUF6657 family protein [Spirochaetia bacterium]
MARIKSALELALERTEGVQGDRSKLDEFEEKQRGRKVYARLSEDPQLDVRKALEEASEKNLAWVKEGFFDAVVSNLNLPNDAPDLERLPMLQKGLEAIIKDRKIAQIFEQIAQFFQQFLDNRTQMVEAVQKQFEGKLRKKEEELSRQMGRRVRVDPAADPEFSQFLRQNLGKLQEQYGQVVDKVREEITALWQKQK